MRLAIFRIKESHEDKPLMQRSNEAIVNHCKRGAKAMRLKCKLSSLSMNFLATKVASCRGPESLILYPAQK